jgi:hypothetical protein
MYVFETKIQVGANIRKLQGEPPVDGDWKAEIMRRLSAKYGG